MSDLISQMTKMIASHNTLYCKKQSMDLNNTLPVAIKDSLFGLAFPLLLIAHVTSFGAFL